MAKFATNARGAILLLNLIQVTESISGSVVPLAMFISNKGTGGVEIFCFILILILFHTLHDNNRVRKSFETAKIAAV